MTAATFTRATDPSLGPGASLYTLDCRHGTTPLGFIPNTRFDLTETQLLAVALAKHDAEENCRCTAPLWRRVAASQARL